MQFSFARSSISTPYLSPHLSIPAHPTCLFVRTCSSVGAREPVASTSNGSISIPHESHHSCPRAWRSTPQQHIVIRAHQM
jgi:hypothetical protein